VDQATGKPFFWLVLVGGVLILGFYAFAGSMIYNYGALNKEFGWSPVLREHVWRVGKVDPQGPAAGKLQPGDRLLAINDDERIREGAVPLGPLWLKLRTIDPGKTYTVRVERNSKEERFELKIPPPSSDHKNAGLIYPLLIVSIAWYIIAMLIGIYRPEQLTARIACIVSFGWTLYLLAASLLPISDLFSANERSIYFLIWIFSLDPLQCAIGYHFHFLFPHGIHRGRLLKFVKYSLYIWGGLLLIFFTILRVVLTRGEEAALKLFHDYSRLIEFTFQSRSVFFLFGLISLCAIIAYNYLRVGGVDRRRIKWLVYGSIAGTLPGSIGQLILILMPATRYNQLLASDGWVLMQWVMRVAPIIVPITTGYAIIKHRIFDINVVVRRGLQYLLAQNVLRIILWLPVIGIVYTLFSNRNRTISEVVFQNSIYFYLLLGAAFSLKFRRQLNDWIDRKFFREVYNQEKILLELAEEIKKLDSMSEISKLLGNQLESALHPNGIFVFYREQERSDLMLGHSTSMVLKRFRISDDSELLHIMEKYGSAQEFPLPERYLLPLNEEEWLKQMEVNLIVPMLGTDQRLVGLLLLGEKRSEEPYTPNDRRLLQAVAGQMAVVYENALLKGRVDKEQKIRQEVLARFEDQKINLVKECPSCCHCYDCTVQFCPLDESELTLSLPVERTVEGKYRLDKLIGKGGMGAVYEAEDMRLGRKVAVKILKGSMFGDQTALRRFEREARVSGRLNHQNIVAVYDFGKLNTEGAYLVMELVSGYTLGTKLKRSAPLDPRLVAEWFEQLIEGVKAAHQAGVIHRDLKPDNILISEQQEGRALIKILDFGLARIRDFDISNRESITGFGTVMGTPGYMSPEQLSSNSVDERGDIFSIGVIVVEALTGNRPFQGKTLNELLTSMLNDHFHLNGDSKEVRALEKVLQKCLAKYTRERFSSVSEMQKELIPAIRRCPPFPRPKRHSQNAETMVLE
jgi:eukaryotic-like serine/threonine-protein kinase